MDTNGEMKFEFIYCECIVSINGESANYLTEILAVFFTILIGIVVRLYFVIKKYKVKK